jgi:hypothetical protein
VEAVAVAAAVVVVAIAIKIGVSSSSEVRHSGPRFFILIPSDETEDWISRVGSVDY